MRKLTFLLMILLAVVLRAGAQNVTTLDVSQLVGYGYPSVRTPGATEEMSNLKNLNIGGINQATFDYYYFFDFNGQIPMVEIFNEPFVYSYPISTSVTSAALTLTASIKTCTQCDQRGVPEEFSDQQSSRYTFSFAGQPLGKTLTSGVLDGVSYYAQYMIEIPPPGLVLTSAPANFCSGDQVVLTSSIIWPNLSGIRYSYEFQLPGSSVWQPLDVTTNASLSFSPLSYQALANYLNAQTSSSSVFFRVRGLTNEFTGQPSDPVNITFAAGPPHIGPVTTTAACASGDGIIQVDGITGMGNYRYVLGSGGICDPDNPASCVVEKSDIFSGPTTGTSLMITGVAQGTYDLLIINDGGAKGACHQSVTVTVNGYGPFTADGTHTNVSCPGGSDGTITVTPTGGKPGATRYQLYNATSGLPIGGMVTTGNFTGLPAGTYRVDVFNDCGTPPPLSFLLTQPTAVTGSFSKTDATCTSPGDGSMTTTVGQGSGTYNYYLYLNGTVVASQLGVSNTSWQVSDLVPGDYSLQVYDAATPGCSAYTATVPIGAPPALGLSVVQQTGLSCNGISTGSMTLQASGGMGTYDYTITDPGSGFSFSNTTGVFTGLPAGSYSAVVRSGVAGCTDQYVYPQPVVVSQPAAINMSLGPVDVRCYGEGNGSIGAVVGGGTGALSLSWEQQAGGVWTSMGTSAATLGSLSPGVYRLSASDANSCSAVSSAVTIAEPSALVIPSVGMTDIVCYGGSGTITPVATGGNGGNVWEYSGDGGVNYAAFAPGASFREGRYQVRVTDSKGCSTGYATSQVITAPASPLVFTDELSDYHGFGISCYGATNGMVTATASGGNGSAYSGYSYSTDGQAYQSSPVLSGLIAGAHVIRVQDARGCVVQQTETLTQPANALSQSLLNKKDNDCVDGLAGILSVSASGGTAPYQFSLDGGTSFQDGGEFTGLTSGGYTITAMDVNGCRMGVGYPIVSLYPPITVTHSVVAVQCNGGSDGSIALDVSGGFGAYTYEWKNPQTGVQPVAGPNAGGLVAGNYVARVTDEKGCVQTDAIVMGQPAPLGAQLVIRPLCSDVTGGSVRITADGGTAPYQYSIDGGHNYQAAAAFTDLPAGAYTVGLTDSHGCTWSQPITITTNSLVPSVNFLVATQQNAQDTLVVVDISVPKPDSVSWTWDPMTLLLGNGPEGPRIRYTQPGTYPATMRAYYAGCDFAVSKDILIQPYDVNSGNPMVQQGRSIDTATIAPNPNPGNFQLYVKLFKAQRLVLTITSLSGQPILRKQWEGQQVITEQVNLPSFVVSGAYIAELVTETEVRDYTLIVTK